MNARTFAATIVALALGCGGAGSGQSATMASAATSSAATSSAATTSGGESSAASGSGAAGVVDGEPSAATPGNAPSGDDAAAADAPSRPPAFATALETSFESPFPTCGPQESYAAIAGYVCPDGSVPLRGDLRAGARARVGSMGAHQAPPGGEFDLMNSHIVDRYEVPCPGGAVAVYVCMYHCDQQ